MIYEIENYDKIVYKEGEKKGEIKLRFKAYKLGKEFYHKLSKLDNNYSEEEVRIYLNDLIKNKDDENLLNEFIYVLLN